MTVIAIVGCKGSPGVTTLSLALGAVWPSRRVAVAECDPSGGDVAARFGLTASLGVSSFVLSLRRARSEPAQEPSLLRRHAQALPGGLDVLVGPAAGDSAFALDEELATLGDPFRVATSVDPDVDLLLDCGRLTAGARGQRLLLSHADAVLLVARPETSSLVSSHWAAMRLTADRPERDGPLLVTVGDTPLHPGEMAEALGVELLGTVSRDPVAAWMVCGSPGRPRALSRSMLISSAGRLARVLKPRAHGSVVAASNGVHSDAR